MAKVSSSVCALLMVVATLNAVSINLNESSQQHHKKPADKGAQDSCADWIKQVQDLKLLLEEKFTLIRNLKEQLAQRDEQIDRLKQELADARKAVSNLTAKIEELVQKLNKWQNDNNGNDKIVKELQKVIDKRDRRIQELEEELARKGKIIIKILSLAQEFDVDQEEDCGDDKKKQQHKKKNNGHAKDNKKDNHWDDKKGNTGHQQQSVKKSVILVGSALNA